jgi:hypothetical protein
MSRVRADAADRHARAGIPDPRRIDRAPAPELLKFDDVSLQTYLTATDADQVDTQ